MVKAIFFLYALIYFLKNINDQKKNTFKKGNTKEVIESGIEVSSQVGPQLGFSHMVLLVDCWVGETDTVGTQGTGQ